MSDSTNGDGENLAHFLCHGDVSHLMLLHDQINDDNRHYLMEYNRNQLQCVHITALEPRDAVEKMKLLVQWGADINGKELKNRDTPLHIGVKTKNYNLVEWLYSQPNINREVVNNECLTPYHIAFINKDEMMMDILKRNGAQCRVPLQSESNSADEDYDYEPRVKIMKQ